MFTIVQIVAYIQIYVYWLCYYTYISDMFLQEIIDGSCLILSVSSADIQSCSSPTRVHVHGNEGYVSSHVTAQTGCGSPRAPWIIEVPPGQTIDMWLLDFGALGRHESTLGLGCQQTLGYIVERNLGSNFTICGDHERRKKLYTSKTNKVELNLLSKLNADDSPIVLVQYTGKCLL